MQEPWQEGGEGARSPAFWEKFAANTFFNFLGRFGAFVATLILTPYLLARLGVETFGVWVLLSVFAHSFGLLDAGLGWSFIKYVSEYRARNEFSRISRVLSVGLLFYLLLGAAFVGLGTVVGPPLLALFQVEVASEVFVVVLAAFGVGNIATLMLGMLRGLQRMDQSNAVEIAAVGFKVTGTVVVLEAGFGLAGLAVNAVVVAVISSVLGWLRLRYVAPSLRLVWAPDLALLRQLLVYGGKLQVVRLSELVCFQVDRLIISWFVGVAPVSIYEVGARLALFMRALPYVMISVLTPAVSELAAVGDRSGVHRIYLLVSKYVIAITVGLVALVVLEADSLLTLWLGSGFEAASPVVQVLAIGYGLNAMSAVAGQTGSGLGRPEFEMGGAILLSVVNPILSVVLIQAYGVAGVAVGTSIALGIGALYVVEAFHRRCVGDSAWSWLFKVGARPFVSALFAAGCLWILAGAVPVLSEAGEDRLSALLLLCVRPSFFIVVYGTCLVLFRHFGNEDLGHARRLLRLPMVLMRRDRGPEVH